MILIPDDFFVRVLDFPDATVGGALVPNDDGTFSVYLNARRSWEEQREAYKHEVGHAIDDDFNNGRPISEVEK